MIRVITKERRLTVLVTIDGHLSGESVGVVESCCDLAGATGKRVQLFLRDVLGVDLAGQELLRRLAAKGVKLAASGVYTSFLVRSLAAAAVPEPTADTGRRRVA